MSCSSAHDTIQSFLQRLTALPSYIISVRSPNQVERCPQCSAPLEAGVCTAQCSGNRILWLVHDLSGMPLNSIDFDHDGSAVAVQGQQDESRVISEHVTPLDDLEILLQDTGEMSEDELLRSIERITSIPVVVMNAEEALIRATARILENNLRHGFNVIHRLAEYFDRAGHSVAEYRGWSLVTVASFVRSYMGEEFDYEKLCHNIADVGEPMIFHEWRRFQSLPVPRWAWRVDANYEGAVTAVGFSLLLAIESGDVPTEFFTTPPTVMSEIVHWIVDFDNQSAIAWLLATWYKDKLPASSDDIIATSMRPHWLPLVYVLADLSPSPKWLALLRGDTYYAHEILTHLYKRARTSSDAVAIKNTLIDKCGDDTKFNFFPLIIAAVIRKDSALIKHARQAFIHSRDKILRPAARAFAIAVMKRKEVESAS